MVDVVKYYADKSILITGATGFMGKVLMEKLLRSCPDIKTMYILVRKKKDQTAEQRLHNIVNCKLFEKLLEMNPKVMDKIKVINGDIMEEGLGLSPQHLEELRNECQIVFNNAASVSFNLSLKEAVKTNVMGTQKVLALADTMKKLEAFVHVSTSFCHDHLKVVEEKVYPAPHSPKNVIDIISWMDDETLATLEKKLVSPFPNTYGYTKCLTEQLISDHGATYPIAIARPSIVIPAFKDPMPGWVDNVNGPNGIMYAASRGVLHTIYCKQTTKTDGIPVDMAINGLIILGCLTATEKPKDIRVCNVTQSGVNAITWYEGSLFWSEYLLKYPLTKCLWYPVVKAKHYEWEQKIDSFFEHTLPAYVIDFMLKLFRQKTFMVSVNKRVINGLNLLQHYCNRNWDFRNEYFKSFKNLITKKDNEIFFTSMEVINPRAYMEAYVQGLRQYYCQEDPSTLPKARKLLNRLYALHLLMMGTMYSLSMYLIYRLYNKFRKCQISTK
ncbi:putative fatty acyl-CoA reductase CG5065 [Danaus plexippus]|uniref:putative fatty acyl-CoA reductase CG5065 n=1 Tax=Danaus plexippus TaxID=13037 RepID=UPI002AB17ACF|nr:putative fatty acyl-CoA reductase CG5065 [Danaus plexippus]